jgi:uncharacterized protein YdaL
MLAFKRRSLRLTWKCIFLVLVLLPILSLGMENPVWAEGRVLVLYDSAGEEGWMGRLYVQHMTNLLSHFEVKVESKPVEQYNAGDLNLYDTTIYLGVIYDNPLPAALGSDLLGTSKTFCWIGYNLWQVAWNNTPFIEKFGIEFVSLDSSAFAEVQYKDKTLTRDDPDPIGVLKIDNPLQVQVLATSYTTNQSQQAPYITKTANLWYVADNPMSYVTMTDRYLAFADILHDILQISHPESHRALVRIEDVSPKADPANLRAIADYLGSEGVPFSVCVIPEYRDPLGVYNGGVPLTVKLSEAPDVVAALRYMESRGGRIVLHGFTHQYDAVTNPYSGVSAEDYEFYRVTLDNTGKQVLQGPVAEDSSTWARERVLQGKSELASLNFTPVAWNTPHYLASVVDYGEFAKLFALSLDRGAYFALDAQGTQYCLNQMAPYVFNKDVYGIKRMPENLGYIDPSGQLPTLPADLLHRADLNKVVRDGWASFYFHWFLDLNYLKEMIFGLKNQGYSFVRVGPCAVAPALQLLLLNDNARGQ